VPDARTACGAVVVLMVLNTPEGSNVGPPATIAGTPRAAVTHGNTSLVTVDVRYRTVPSINAPPTPARARISSSTAEEQNIRFAWKGAVHWRDTSRDSSGGATEIRDSLNPRRSR